MTFRQKQSTSGSTLKGGDTLKAPPAPFPQAIPVASTLSQQPFTYYLYNFLTGAFLGTLPFRGVSFGSNLNTPGQFQGTVDLTDPRVAKANPINLTIPNRTFLVIDYDGSPVWSGILQTRRWQVSSSGQSTQRMFQVQGSEGWAYFQQRVQATDYSAPPYSGIYPSPTTMPIWDASSSGSTWDPMLIAGQIISDALSYAQSVSIPNGNPLGGMSVLYNFLSAAAYKASASATPPADYINITYPYSTMQSIDTIITQLSELGYGIGFDFGVDVAYSSGPGSPPVATINLSYPRRGRAVAQSNLWVDLSRARAYEFPEDGTATANQVYETGGSGAIDVTENIYPLEGGYPLLERVISRSQLTSSNIMELLAQTAYTDLYQYSYAPVAPSVTVDLFNGNPRFGSFIDGDDIEVFLPAEDQSDLGYFDPRFPAGLQQEWRIAAWQATVGDEGDSTLELTLNQPPTLLPTSPAI